MSTALGIASVTAVLKDLLNNGLVDHDLTPSIGDVKVSALPPDRIATEPTEEQSQLNLFLYQVTPNQGWREVGLPTHDSRGERVSNQPLALDLHYLLTAYGAEDLHSEILLGYAMQLLHETPVLSRAAIRRALAPPSPVSSSGLPPALRSLSTSELDDQVELVKITPESLAAEDLSKLWTAFQAHYRATAAYRASVVLIQGEASTRTALPVRDRNVYADPLAQPQVDGVVPAEGRGVPIVAGSTLHIRGRHLDADVTRVRIDGDEHVPTSVSGTEIVLSLGAVQLRAGGHGLQVVHRREMGTPETPHAGVDSNLVLFVLQPLVTDVQATNVVADGDLRSADVTLDITPRPAANQRIDLFLNAFSGGTAPPGTRSASYSFTAPHRAHDADPVVVPVANVEAGDYLVRVRVDGADSPLSFVETPGQPPLDHFVRPRVAIA